MVHLMGVYFTEVHLMGVNLINVHLKGVHLMCVYLTGVHLMGVTLAALLIDCKQEGYIPLQATIYPIHLFPATLPTHAHQLRAPLASGYHREGVAATQSTYQLREDLHKQILVA